jgi:hypothetical protein
MQETEKSDVFEQERERMQETGEEEGMMSAKDRDTVALDTS